MSRDEKWEELRDELQEIYNRDQDYDALKEYERKYEAKVCEHEFQAIGPRRGFCKLCDLDAAIDVDGVITWCKEKT